MKIKLSKYMSEELEHKLWVLHDNEEGLECYKISQDDVSELINSIQFMSEWEFDNKWLPVLKIEMEDYPTFICQIEPVSKPIYIKHHNTEIFVYDDGGRELAGYKGNKVGDCVTRAIAIATQKPYREVYTALFDGIREHKSTKRDGIARKLNKSRSGSSGNTPRNGVHRAIYEKYLKSIGWKWVAVSGIGTGCKMHFKASEVPSGRIICALSKHLSTMIDGVIHDTYDCSREGSRCVYGFYCKE